MSNNNDRSEIYQFLKCELYGRLAACGIAFAILAVCACVQHKKDQEKKTQYAIEQVKTVKNAATDSIGQRVR